MKKPSELELVTKNNIKLEFDNAIKIVTEKLYQEHPEIHQKVLDFKARKKSCRMCGQDFIVKDLNNPAERFCSSHCITLKYL